MRPFKRGERARSDGPESTEKWRKASGSWANGDCVEIGQLVGPVVGVRDSANRRGPVLEFDVDEWIRFLARVRAGRFPR